MSNGSSVRLFLSKDLNASALLRLGTSDAVALLVRHHTRSKRQTKNASIKEASRLRAESEVARRDRALQRENQLATLLRAAPDALSRFIRVNPSIQDYAKRTPRFRELCKAMQRKAPRLLEEYYIGAFVLMSRLAWLRPLADWTPNGKGKSSLFRSLVQHLFAAYPTPDIVWSMFFHPDADKLTATLAGVAAGESLFRLANRHLPLVLTKKQCHHILTKPGSSDFLIAVRSAQFVGLGTNRRVLVAWLSSNIGQRLHEKSDEEFYLSYVRLCAQAINFNSDMFTPLLDYLAYRRNENGDFSLKGRTLTSLIRGMHEWHAALHQQAAFLSRFKGSLPTSGFPGALYRSIINGKGSKPKHHTWRIQEIVTAETLFTEGRAQKHCVYSYAQLILNNTTSIWSMTLNEGAGAGPERAVTIELRNAERKVVQIRGFANRRVKKSELIIIARWASESGLQIARNA